MRLRISSQLSTLAVGGGSRAVAIISQFVALLILTAAMSPQVFGEFMISYAIFRLIALALGTGLGSFVLFHVGRSQGDAAESASIHRTALLAGLLTSSVLALLISNLAQPLSSIFGKPSLESWLHSLWPYMIAHSMVLISVGYFDGKSNINRSILLSDLTPNIVQVALLTAMLVFELDAKFVPVIIFVSFVSPWILFAAPSLLSQISLFKRMTWWDLRYAASYSLTTLVSQQIYGIDVLIAGLLLPSEQVAIYAVCARISLLFPFFQILILRKYAPSGGSLLARGLSEDFSAGILERKWVILSSNLFVGGAIIFTAPYTFYLMGLSGQGVYVLIGLSSVYIVRANFSGIDVALKMSGNHGLALALSSFSSVTLVFGAYLLSGALGSHSFAVSLLLASLTTSIYASAILNRAGIYTDSTRSRLICAIALALIVSSLMIESPTIAAIISGGGFLALAFFSYWLVNQSK